MKEQERPLVSARVAPFWSWGTGPTLLMLSADTSTRPKKRRSPEPETKRVPPLPGVQASTAAEQPPVSPSGCTPFHYMTAQTQLPTGFRR